MHQNGHTVNENIKNKILDTFLMQDLENESREDLLLQILRIVFQSVLLRVTPLLDEEDLAQYSKILEEGAGVDECTEFFVRIVPMFESIVYEEIQTIAKVLEKENPGAILQLNAEKKIEDIRNALLQKFG